MWECSDDGFLALWLVLVVGVGVLWFGVEIAFGMEISLSLCRSCRPKDLTCESAECCSVTLTVVSDELYGLLDELSDLVSVVTECRL